MDTDVDIQRGRIPRVGHINFLNVLPLTYRFAHGGGEGMDIVQDVPSALNKAIQEGRLDVSPVSSIVYARHAEHLLLLPDICIRSDADVQSIVLVSRVPIEAIGEGKVILTAKSATSHCLLKTLLSMGYGAGPKYEIHSIGPEDPVPGDATAALFIGDDALYLYHHCPEGLFCYDLGKEWRAFAGRPMVYAVWVARREFAAAFPEQLRMVHSCIVRGMQEGLAQKDAAIRSVLEHKPFTYAQLDEYLGTVIRWDLTEEHLEDLRTFYRLCHRMGLIDCVPELEMARLP